MPVRGFVYGLEHAGEIRYVGKTETTLARRLRRHLREASVATPGKRHVFDWIRSVAYDVNIVTLEKNPFDLGEAERAWIATLRRYGCALTNVAEGGNGAVVYGRTPWNKGKKGVSAETSAMMAASARARIRTPHTEESREKISEALKGHPKLIESGRRCGLMMAGRQFTKESRRKAADSNRKLWQNYTPEERQRRCDAIREGIAKAKARQGGDAR